MASKAYFGYQNLFPDSSIILARTESSVYPASNLTKHRLWPGYRSADSCVTLNGTDEYFYVADHADFDLTTAATFEVVFKTPSSFSGQQNLLAKFNASSGYRLSISASGNLTFHTDTATNYVTMDTALSVSTWYRAKWVYNAGTVKLYINGEAETGLTTTGTIPVSLGTNGVDVGIGSTAAGSGYFAGSISYVGIDDAVKDNGGYLDPGQCVGYWGFDDSADRTADSSVQGHDLTAVNIDENNYTSCTAFQWVQIIPDGSLTLGTVGSPDIFFLDRRHNISDGVTIKLIKDTAPSSYTILASDTVTADEPVVIEGLYGYGGYYLTLEIHDPDNVDGYIEIPYIYWGQPAELAVNPDDGAPLAYGRHGQQIPDSGGGYTTYVNSEELWSIQETFKDRSGSDKTILDAVNSYAGLGKPVVYSCDGAVANARLVYILSALENQFQHQTLDVYMYVLDIAEVGGGI